MPLISSVRRPATGLRSRAVLALATVLALLGTTLVVAAPASAETTGAVNAIGLSVTDDGTFTTDGLDTSTTNGLVATNNAVTMSWQIEGVDLVDGVVTQTLPEGWSWVTSSLGKLSSNSSLYQSSYTISEDGRTLTATMSIPGSNLISVSGLQAVPGATVVAGSGYTPELTATDASRTLTATGTALTVVGVPQVTLGLASATRTDSTYDFGSGSEAAVRAQVSVTYRAADTLVGQQSPVELDVPLQVTLTVDGPTPQAVTVCDSDTSGLLRVVSAADGQIVVEVLAQPTSAAVTARLCLWYEASELPDTAAEAEALTVVMTDPGLTTTDGATVLRTGGTSIGTVLYDGSSTPTPTDVRAATSASSVAGWNWVSYSTGPVLPASSVTNAGWSQAPTYVTSGGMILFSATYTPAYDYATKLSVGTEDLIGYQFWDPAAATIAGDASVVFVGLYRTKIDASTYTLEFTNTRVTTDPGTANTWYSSVEEAGGAAAVSGVRVVYTGGLWAEGLASGTGSQMSFNLPLVARADGLVTSVTSQQIWTSADATPLTRYSTMAIRPFSVSTTITRSPAQVVSGSPVTYTVYASAGRSTTQPPSTPDYPVTATLTVTLPTSIASYDITDATDKGWTLVSETAADLGADGLPGTADDGTGAVLVFSRSAVVDATSGADLPSFTLPVVTALQAPVKETMTAKSALSVAMTDPAQKLSATASVSTSVLQAESLVLEGTTSTPRVGVTDDTVQWSTRWYNYSTAEQSGSTYVLDVLPYDGDARGTSTDATLTLTSVTLRGDTDGAVVEVTTTPPSAIGAAPGSSATWTTLTETTDLSAVTAVRVLLPGVAVGAGGALDLGFSISGHALDDVLVNSATAVFEGSTVTLGSDDVPVTVTGASVAGRVLLDPDRDGLATSDGEPVSGATVRLVSTTSDQVLTVVTDENGAYRFDAVGAGTFRVEVDQRTIAGVSVTPTVDPDDTLDGMTEVTVSGFMEVTGLDFAFAVRNPAVAVTAVATTPSGDLAAGDTVELTYTVTNTGDSVLSEVTVQDSLDADRAVRTCDWPGTEGELAVDAVVTCTVTYTLDQDEVDAGTVVSAVQVSAVDDAGTEVSASAQAQVALPSGASLAITGSGAAPATIATGEEVTWSVTVENTGAVTVTDLALSDALAGTSGYTVTWPGTAGRLAPGEKATATATTALTQAQVDAGTVVSEVTATGRASDADLAATAQIPVTFEVPGALEVRMTVDGGRATEAPGTQVTDGDDVAWTYTVTNTGAATLHDLVVTDDRDPATTISAPDGFSGDLAPGESVVLTATSVAVLGERSVTAVAQATAGSGSTQAVGTDTVWVTAVPAELGVITGHVRIDTDRDGLVGGAGEPAVGTRVVLVDTATGTTVRTTATDSTGGYRFAALAAGTYRVEVDTTTVAGASVTVTVDPDGTLDGVTEVTVGSRDTVSDVDFAVAVRNPALTVTGAAQATGDALAAGDQVTVVWTVTNTGDTPLSGTTLVDSADAERAVVTAAWPGEEGVLAPGASATFTEVITLDQADVDAGVIEVRAHAGASDDLGGAVESSTVAVRVAVPSGASLTVTGTGELPGTLAAGEQVSWTFTVLNSGAVTVTDLTLAEALTGMSELEISWPGEAGVLAPGEQLVATATSALTQEQVDQGAVTARTTATGLVPAGTEITATAPTELTFEVPAAVSLELTLNGERQAEQPGLAVTVGDRLTWSVLVTNTGTATLHQVTVSDDMAETDGLLTLVYPEDFSGDLAPGEQVVVTATSAAVRGTQAVTVTVSAVRGAGPAQVQAADTAWYTGAPVVVADGTDGGTTAEPSTDGGSETSAAQVLAITGASVLGLAVLALLLFTVGSALVRARRTREER
jgi:uncharacterized repeat protein (TIGR01451 family)